MAIGVSLRTEICTSSISVSIPSELCQAFAGTCTALPCLVCSVPLDSCFLLYDKHSLWVGKRCWSGVMPKNTYADRQECFIVIKTGLQMQGYQFSRWREKNTWWNRKNPPCAQQQQLVLYPLLCLRRRTWSSAWCFIIHTSTFQERQWTYLMLVIWLQCLLLPQICWCWH